MISAYLDELAGALRFDRALSRCVLQEVEDHLREAVAADPAQDRLEAERRAVVNFGDARLLAAQFAVVALTRQARRAGVAVVLAITAVLAAMQARIAWYSVLQWTMSKDEPLAAIVLGIDRFAFWLAAALGIGALLSVGRRRMSGALDQPYRRQLRRARWLCAGAILSLIVTVICDGALTALRLGTEWRAEAMVPIIAMALEVACAGVVAFLVHGAMRRAGSIETLLKA